VRKPSPGVEFPALADRLHRGLQEDLMKLSSIGALVGLLMTGGALTAQDRLPDRGTITVTGCLNRAQRNGSVGGTIVGTTAAPNTADDEANSSVMVDAFLLTNAKPASAGDDGSGAPGGAPSTAGTAGRVDPTTYGLQGREPELERHSGARLEVTGTILPPASSGRGTGGAATATGARRLRVESFKVLAEQCSAQ
jgi:hypothetical protein